MGAAFANGFVYDIKATSHTYLFLQIMRLEVDEASKPLGAPDALDFFLTILGATMARCRRVACKMCSESR